MLFVRFVFRIFINKILQMLSLKQKRSSIIFYIDSRDLIFLYPFIYYLKTKSLYCYINISIYLYIYNRSDLEQFALPFPCFEFFKNTSHIAFFIFLVITFFRNLFKMVFISLHPVSDLKPLVKRFRDFVVVGIYL